MKEKVATSVQGKLAREAAEHFVRTHDFFPAETRVSPELSWQGACFVTVLEMPGRRLRARYGQALPQQPTLAHEIVVNTVQALVSNPARRVARADLASLRFVVAVLGPLGRVSGPEHLDPARAGLYMRSDRGKTALLLPSRAGVETGDDQIATGLREAGIDSRQEAVTLYRFEVQSYEG